MSEQPENPLKRIVSLLRNGPRALYYRFKDQLKRRRTGAPLWEVTRITDGLYVGGQHYPKGWDEMLDEGITSVLNMRETWHNDEDSGIGSENHLHLHTIDNTPVSLDNLDHAANFIHTQIAHGGKVYVHCGVGVGRAPSAAAAYFIKQGMTTVEALARIRQQRPFIHLTGSQRRQLEKYEVYLKDQATDDESQEPAHDSREAQAQT